MPREVATLIICILFSILFVLSTVMVIKSPSAMNYSPGLLPTPRSRPNPDLRAENYIGSSLYPIPFQAVIMLDGCSLSDLVSWDLSVSSKVLKVKLDWSCDTKSSSNYNLQEKILPNLEPVYTMPVRNETVTKSLRLGLAFTRYRCEET